MKKDRISGSKFPSIHSTSLKRVNNLSVMKEEETDISIVNPNYESIEYNTAMITLERQYFCYFGGWYQIFRGKLDQYTGKAKHT